MCGHEVVKIIVNKWRLINTIQDCDGKGSSYDQARDRQYFSKKGLSPESNSLGNVPSSVEPVVLPRMKIFLKPCLRLVSFSGNIYGVSSTVGHLSELADSSLLL